MNDEMKLFLTAPVCRVWQMRSCMCRAILSFVHRIEYNQESTELTYVRDVDAGKLIVLKRICAI